MLENDDRQRRHDQGVEPGPGRRRRRVARVDEGEDSEAAEDGLPPCVAAEGVTSVNVKGNDKKNDERKGNYGGEHNFVV